METASSAGIIFDIVGLLKLLITENGVPAVVVRRKKGKLTLFAEWNEANGDAQIVTTDNAPVKLSRRDNRRWNTKQRCGDGKPSTVLSGDLDPKITKNGASKKRMSPSAQARSRRRLSYFIESKIAASKEMNVPHSVDGLTKPANNGPTDTAKDWNSNPSAESGLPLPAPVLGASSCEIGHVAVESKPTSHPTERRSKYALRSESSKEKLSCENPRHCSSDEYSLCALSPDSVVSCDPDSYSPFADQNRFSVLSAGQNDSSDAETEDSKQIFTAAQPSTVVSSKNSDIDALFDSVKANIMDALLRRHCKPEHNEEGC